MIIEIYKNTLKLTLMCGSWITFSPVEENTSMKLNSHYYDKEKTKIH